MMTSRMNNTRIAPVEVKAPYDGIKGSKHADMESTPFWTNRSDALCILCYHCMTDCVLTYPLKNLHLDV
jgi:predicted molibdopterin-dependent oxidoreductase YjgC